MKSGSQKPNSRSRAFSAPPRVTSKTHHSSRTSNRWPPKKIVSAKRGSVPNESPQSVTPTIVVSSTPPSVPSSSPKAQESRIANEGVPETPTSGTARKVLQKQVPPQTRNGPGQRNDDDTASRRLTTASSLGNSPASAIDIASDHYSENGDSPVEQACLVSPKRKRARDMVNAKRNQNSQRTKMTLQSSNPKPRPHSGTHEPVNAPGDKTQNNVSAALARCSQSSTALITQDSRPKISMRAIKAKYRETPAPQKMLTTETDDSDCVLVKAVPSPKRAQVSQTHVPESKQKIQAVPALKKIALPAKNKLTQQDHQVSNREPLRQEKPLKRKASLSKDTINHENEADTEDFGERSAKKRRDDAVESKKERCQTVPPATARSNEDSVRLTMGTPKSPIPRVEGCESDEAIEAEYYNYASFDGPVNLEKDTKTEIGRPGSPVLGDEDCRSRYSSEPSTSPTKVLCPENSDFLVKAERAQKKGYPSSSPVSYYGSPIYRRDVEPVLTVPCQRGGMLRDGNDESWPVLSEMESKDNGNDKKITQRISFSNSTPMSSKKVIGSDGSPHLAVPRTASDRCGYNIYSEGALLSSGGFEPHHRTPVKSLRGILKSPRSWSKHAKRRLGADSRRNLPNDQNQAASPTQAATHSVKEAKNIPLHGIRHILGNVEKSDSSPKLRTTKSRGKFDELSVDETPSTVIAKTDKKGWIHQKRSLTPLGPNAWTISSDDGDELWRNLGTPTRVSGDRATEPPLPVASKRNDADASSQGHYASTIVKPKAREQVRPIPIIAPPAGPQAIKPRLMRDGVSEHAVKPTIARLKNKIAAGEIFASQQTVDPSHRYTFETDWSLPVDCSDGARQALEAELHHRGIKTDRQYGNFWYNLMSKYSRLAGSPVPLFTMKKKALDDFVEESIQNREWRRLKLGPPVQKTKAETHSPQTKDSKPASKKIVGIEALLLWGAGQTDDESTSDSSDGEGLLAKTEDEEK